MEPETPRLCMREFLLSDAHDLYEILGDGETMAYSEPPYSLEKTKNFLKDFCIRQKGAIAAVHKDSGKVIGYILFHKTGKEEYELGWFFNRKYWGQGYAFEACSAVTEYAFSVLKAQRLFAETADTEKSLGLMKKLGMQWKGTEVCQGQDGLLQIYSLSAAVWQEQKSRL